MTTTFHCETCQLSGVIPDGVTFSSRAVVTCGECGGSAIDWRDDFGQPLPRPEHTEDIVVQGPAGALDAFLAAGLSVSGEGA